MGLDGVDDVLVDCVGGSDQSLEYGIIEHKYKVAHPGTYAEMVRGSVHRSNGTQERNVK